MDNGLLVVISGPSGAGKGTICKRLKEVMKDLKVSVSTTTRKPRNGEVEGESYFLMNYLNMLKYMEIITERRKKKYLNSLKKEMMLFWK